MWLLLLLVVLLVLLSVFAVGVAWPQDSVYIRAVGFLYLRLATDAGELWDWFAPYLDDPQEITPGADPSTRTYVHDHTCG